MNKKAQITWFILVGIVVLIVGGFFIYLYSTRSDKEIEKVIEIPANIMPIKNYVEECIKELTPPGIYLLAAKGGYIYSYKEVLNSGNIQVAYHAVYNENASPSMEFMEQELSTYVEEALKNCIDFSTFPQFKIEAGEMHATSSFGKERVVVDLNYPVTIISQDSKIVIAQYTAEFPFRLGHILNIKEKTLSNLLNTGQVGFDLLSSFDVEFNVLPYSEDTIVYSIFDEASGKDVPFFFNFAVKVYGNFAPRLEFLPDYVLTKGKLFEYQLEAYDHDENDVLRFYTENALIDMNEDTGYFTFTPLISGDYEIEVCVQDRYLTEDCGKMKFMIEDE